MIKDKRNKYENAITLIALVITIIVLLILAGVSIAMLTGENGILNQANKAKTETDYKGAEEKVKLAIMGARADDGQMTVEELTREIGYQSGTITGTEFPVKVIVDGHTFTINNNGIIANDALETVTGKETTNTTVKDKLGNQVVVPAGFKVVNPTETVLDGIVIEDVDETRATVGSQFVWIPVGKVKKANGSIENITLSRYTFNENGKETDQGNKVIGAYHQELTISDYGNIVAKDLEEFKTKVTESKGYYIGRYEARTDTKRTEEGNALTQITVKPDDYVYNFVTQAQAANLSRNMYRNNNFESDLINSYAWDTAIVFLQKFDNRTNQTIPYSIQTSLNKTLAEKGTNKLNIQDKICNIYDMASNTFEWTTETSKHKTYFCAGRGGKYRSDNVYTSLRDQGTMIGSYDDGAFRPILYL